MVSSIMVIDNDPHIRVLLNEILTPAGYEVHLYTYELPDRDELLRVHPALIICDYLLDDDQPGRELWAIISREPALANTCLLLCSTSVECLAERTGWWNAAGIPIIAKPFDVDDFLCAVQRALISPGAMAPEARTSLMSAATAQVLHALPPPGVRLNTRIGA